MQIANILGNGLANFEVSGIGRVVGLVVINGFVRGLFDEVWRGAGVFAQVKPESSLKLVGQRVDRPNLGGINFCRVRLSHESSSFRVPRLYGELA